MRLPKRTDLDNEAQRTYFLAPDWEYVIPSPVAIYYDPENPDVELILDALGEFHLVPRIGGRTAVVCRIFFTPGTDEPLS